MSFVALFNAALYFCVHEQALASEKEEEAKKYTQQLRTSKDTKVRITALRELGTLGQIKKSFIADALPEIYRAVEDKDPAVRAAAAEALGKADEPYEKVGEILVKMLKDEKDDNAKIGALKGLSAMRGDAKGALPTIRDIAKSADKKSKLGQAAIEAAKAIAGTGKKN
jgi:HEAT repeat protein